MRLAFDLRDFKRIARSLQALETQIPFALAQALNDGAEVARNQLPQTWAQHITVRNPNFLKAALTTRGARANKRTLRVELYDKIGRGNLKLHDTGGRRTPRGTAIAVPNAPLQARRGIHGVPKGMRPKNVPNSFRKGDAIYQRTGFYKKAGKRSPAQDNRHLKLMYVLRPSVPIRADVPFHRDFETIMRREVRRAFGPRLQAAMKTAFRK